MRLVELRERLQVLRDAVVRLLDVLPPGDRFEPAVATAIEDLAAALSPRHPPPRADEWHGMRDGARHFLCDGGPRTFDETVAVSTRYADSDPRDWTWPQTRFGPGLVLGPETFGVVVVALLRELERRVTPGRVVDGPLLSSAALHRLTLAHADRMRRAAGRADGFPVRPAPVVADAGRLVPPDRDRAQGWTEVEEPVGRWERLSECAAWVVALLPRAGCAPEADARVRAVAALLCPPPRTAGFDPARHVFLAGPPGNGSGAGPCSFTDAAALIEQHIAAGAEDESRLHWEALGVHRPPLTGMSVRRAEAIAALLTDLAERLRPGCVVEGPIVADDRYRRLVELVAWDLMGRPSRGGGPTWDWDVG